MRASLEAVKELLKNKITDKQDKDNHSIVGVEVGVFKGGNAKNILSQMPNITILHLVDSYLNEFSYAYPEAKQLLKEYDNRIVWHVMASCYAAKNFLDGTIDFVYIDGKHSYEDVKTDINAWWPKVRIGGVLCGHDYISPDMSKHVTYDVRDAVDEFIKEKGLTLQLVLEPSHEGKDWWTLK